MSIPLPNNILEPRSRYPGSQPFTKDYETVFKGRAKEMDDLIKLVALNRLMVLYGRSGYGKSSLLNVGLVPGYEKKEYEPVFVRFSSYSKEGPKNLSEIFNASISKKIASLPKKDKVDSGSIFLPNIQSDNISLWQNFKQLEWLLRKKKGILLILDQFEEIFTYPEGLEFFAQSFSELIFNRIPNEFQKELYEKIGSDPKFIQEYEQQLEVIETPNPVRIVIGIRSDKVSLLNRLSLYVPNILKTCYELLPLNNVQAAEAIVLPAAAEVKQGDPPFKSPRFGYAKETLAEILNFLTQKDSKPIESFQLQVICRHFEEKMEQSGTENEVLQPIGTEKLELIFQHYYRNVIKGNLPDGTPRFTPFEQLMVRYLIEKRLIDIRNRVRISLDKSFVEQIGITDEMLEKLVDSRLIRREPNAVSGLSFELSHDTLIEPIVRASTRKEDLEDLETIADTFYEETLTRCSGYGALDVLSELLKSRMEALFLDPQGERRMARLIDFKDAQERALIASMPIVNYDKKLDGYEISSVFVSTLRRQRNEWMRKENESQAQAVVNAQEETQREKTLRKRLFFFLVLAVLMTLLAGGFILYSRYQAQRAEQLQKELDAAQSKLTIQDYYQRARNLEQDPDYRRGALTLYREAKTQASAFLEEFKADTGMIKILQDIDTRIQVLER